MESNVDQDIVVYVEVDIDIMAPIDSIMDTMATSHTKDASKGYHQDFCTINIANDTINNASKTQYNAEVMQNNFNVTHSNNTCKQNNVNLEENSTLNNNTFTTKNVAQIQSKNSKNDVNNTVRNENVDEIQSNVNNANKNVGSGANFQQLYKIHPVLDNINQSNKSSNFKLQTIKESVNVELTIKM